MLRAILLLAAVGIVVVSSQAADLRVTPKKQTDAPPLTCVEESLCEAACVNGNACRVLTCASKTWRWFGQTCGGANGPKCGQRPRCP